MKNVKVAVIQMKVTENKEENIKRAEERIQVAAENGAKIIALPEIFNSPYSTACFEEYAEVYPGETSKRMIRAARENEVYLVAGSIPEKDGADIYNTSYVYSPVGELLGRHRKMHLFDIDVKGGQYFKESDVLTPGEDFLVVDTEYGKLGVGICYDIRFPEYFRALCLEGAEIIVLPAAFNMTTGPAHWDISIRMRAVDNQVYLMAASPARVEGAGYISYANSRIANPWGEIIASAGTEEEIIYSELSAEKLENTREGLPLLKHRRKDKYQLIY